MSLPEFPHERLTALARHLAVTSAAVAAYEPLMTSIDYMNADYERAAAEAHGHLVNSYLMAREDFERTRAQFEHDFMTWHVDTLADTDAYYRRGAPSQAAPPQPASAAAYTPPAWTETEPDPDPVSLAAAKAADDALRDGV